VVEVKTRKVVMQQPAYPDLRTEDLSPMDPVEFRARDGLVIRGYLTTSRSAGKQRQPMVVLVHGGPHGASDTYEFDPEAQLLASRGYAVLQVNFRGSGGRGRGFETAGYGEWGRLMQDDITDGVRWAIADGVADPARVCIMGTSYGAYSALAGSFREPELFRCAIGISGVYDLPTMFDRGDIQETKLGVRYMKEVIGSDPEDLRRRSPTYNAEKIKAAVLLIHGTADERAPITHAVKMKAALEKAGNPPEWLTEAGEQHGFQDQKHRAGAYERILEFLRKHIGGG
jgi:dipeptidyl aminopeptidase/acylaminoacyl peptidase